MYAAKTGRTVQFETSRYTTRADNPATHLAHSTTFLRRGCRDKRERCRLSKLIRSGLRQEMRRRLNARLNDVLLEFRDLNRLESIRHDPLNNTNRYHEHDPHPDEFAEYLAGIFAVDEADLPNTNPPQHILNIPPFTK